MRLSTSVALEWARYLFLSLLQRSVFLLGNVLQIVVLVVGVGLSGLLRLAGRTR